MASKPPAKSILSTQIKTPSVFVAEARVLGSAVLGFVFGSQTAWAAEVSAPTPERMLAHFESWIALAIVVFAFGAAWLLNHQAPKLRARRSASSCWGCLRLDCCGTENQKGQDWIHLSSRWKKARSRCARCTVCAHVRGACYWLFHDQLTWVPIFLLFHRNTTVLR